MHVNRVRIEDIWCSFDVLNVTSKNKNSSTDEVMAVAIFTREGKELHRIYNLGNFNYCAKLLDNDFAKEEAERMINRANVSSSSPFK